MPYRSVACSYLYFWRDPKTDRIRVGRATSFGSSPSRPGFCIADQTEERLTDYEAFCRSIGYEPAGGEWRTTA